MLGLIKKIFNALDSGAPVLRRPLYITRLTDGVDLYRGPDGRYVNNADKNDYIPIKLVPEIIAGEYPEAYALSEKEAPNFHHHP